jgi:hypothetical protein
MTGPTPPEQLITDAEFDELVKRWTVQDIARMIAALANRLVKAVSDD